MLAFCAVWLFVALLATGQHWQCPPVNVVAVLYWVLFAFIFARALLIDAAFSFRINLVLLVATDVRNKEINAFLARRV